MTADDKTPKAFSLARWSRVKREAARAAQDAKAVPPDPAPAAAPVAAPVATEATPPALPPIDSLTIDSDFTAYLHPEVDEGLKRQALKKLFADPRFNVMDGLDVYIDDYSKPDPLDPAIAEKLARARAILEPKPPAPRRSPDDAGVPAEEVAATAAAQGAAMDETATAKTAELAAAEAPPVADNAVPPSDTMPAGNANPQ